MLEHVSMAELAGPVRWSLKMACRISKSFVSLFGCGHLQRRISERPEGSSSMFLAFLAMLLPPVP